MLLKPYAPFGPLLTAMVTPLDESGAIDYRRAQELAVRLMGQGSTGMVVSGTTGESPTLSPQEKLKLFRAVKEALGGAPVIANTGDNNTAHSIEFSRQAQAEGVDGLLLVGPYYNKPSQEGLYQHFKAIAEAVDLPCLLYNVPGRTGRSISAETQARLSEIPNIVGTKEASADMVLIGRLRSLTDPKFAIYSGEGIVTLPMLALGCCGCISVLSHVAGTEFRAMMEAFWCGDGQRALEIHSRLLPVETALFPADTPSPAPVKAALSLQGFDCGGLRLPLLPCSVAEREQLRGVLNTAGLLPNPPINV